MKKYFEVLKSCPLFLGIDEDKLSSVPSCLGAHVAKYEKSGYILTEGDKATLFGIVLSGSVRIEKNDYFGNRSIVGRAAVGELFAESFACAGVASMPVSVIAESECEILILENLRVMSPCDNVCDFHRRIIFNLMKIMAMKNLAFHRKVEVISKRTTREKLLAYLALEAERAGAASFDIPFDRQALADYLGVDRSGLSAEISKLRDEGVIRCRKNSFELL